MEGGKTRLPVQLTDEQKEKIRYLAALGWTDQELAGWLGMDLSDFVAEYSAHGSELHRLVTQGQLQKRAEIEIGIARSAEKGDMDSFKAFRDIVRDKSFSISKLDLFGGPEDEGAFQRIQEYIASGSSRDLSPDEQVYIDMLLMIHSLDGRYGKRKVVKFLTGEPFRFSYSRAVDMYSEATEMFFCDRNVSRKALRNKIAEQYDTLYHLTVQSAKTPLDYRIAAEILEREVKLKQLDRDDPQKLAPQQYLKQYRVLTTDPKSIGLPPTNRDVLAAQIDAMQVPEQTKGRLRMEAGIQDVDIVKILDNVVQEEG